jgi:hypothetical protein
MGTYDCLIDFHRSATKERLLEVPRIKVVLTPTKRTLIAVQVPLKLDAPGVYELRLRVRNAVHYRTQFQVERAGATA